MTSHTGVRRKVGDRRSRATPGLVDFVEDLAATGERRYVPVPPGGDQPASISGFQSGVPFFAPLEPLSGSDDRSLVSSDDFLAPHLSASWTWTASPRTLCEVEIVDAHQHFINLTDLVYPWIESRQPALAALLPNYYDAAHQYLPQDYWAQVNPMPITTSVACEFGAGDGVAEAMWVHQCADRFGVPNAFIAAVQLDSDGLPSVLARYRDLPTVRAVRQPLYWAADPIKRLGARGDYLSDPAWLRGFEQVADAGLVWDLLVYDEQLSATHNLITSFPDTTFVLEALGWPLDLSTEGFSRWEERLSAVSEFPNVVLKLQGIALIFGTAPEAIGRWIRMALSIFGARRCMFATHYPVDHLLWDSQTMVSTIQATLGELSSKEQAEFFGETARRVYRLPASS